MKKADLEKKLLEARDLLKGCTSLCDFGSKEADELYYDIQVFNVEVERELMGWSE